MAVDPAKRVVEGGTTTKALQPDIATRPIGDQLRTSMNWLSSRIRQPPI
jgi:hypothetical protein